MSRRWRQFRYFGKHICNAGPESFPLHPIKLRGARTLPSHSPSWIPAELLSGSLPPHTSKTARKGICTALAKPPFYYKVKVFIALYMCARRLYDAVMFVLKVLMNGGAMNSDGSVPPSFEMQVANLLVALLALLLVRMAFNRQVMACADD